MNRPRKSISQISTIFFTEQLLKTKIGERINISGKFKAIIAFSLKRVNPADVVYCLQTRTKVVSGYDAEEVRNEYGLEIVA